MDMNDSLIEIALREMKSKRKPRTLARIAKDVFEVKGLDIKKEKKALAQFQMDFMLSGYFVCCGEDKHGNKVWDLKNRQPSSLLDKDGSLLEDLYEYDEDVLMHELKDDTIYYKEGEIYSTDDDDEDEVEHDEIEEELLSLDEDEDEEDDIEDDLLDEFDDLDEDEEFLELDEDDDEFGDEI